MEAQFIWVGLSPMWVRIFLYGASLDISSGAPNLAFAKPNNTVSVVVADGSGGWYIGGVFTEVGGQVRNRIARINADGSLNAWDPNASSPVLSITVNGGYSVCRGIFYHNRRTGKKQDRRSGIIMPFL
jgi:hypothetical protein